MSNRDGEVDQFLQALNHPMKAEIVNLREAILASNAQISEHIKLKGKRPASAIAATIG